MSENKCRAERDFSRFDSMSSAELQEILRQDALQESTEPDTEMILYITEVLAKREKERDPSAEVQRAYQSFARNYLPADQTNTTNKPASFVTRMPRWLRSVAVLAAVLGLLLMGTAGADAMGFDLFGMVAHWTAEIFHFSDATEGTEYTEPGHNNMTEFESLQEALDQYKIKQRLAPKWLPTGYSLAEIEVFSNPFEKSFFAMYKRENLRIQISIRQLIGSVPEQIEKSEGFIETCEANGISYYLFQNNKRLQAVWHIGEYEGVIAGDISIEEMKAMIESI